MSELVETLKRFNRKERNWLVRDALGEGAEKLSTSFRNRLSESIRPIDKDISVPDDAWWCTDFHIDWLIGALTMLQSSTTGGDVVGVAPFEKPPSKEPPSKERMIVTGNQQDIDLVVAWGTTLVLIEAKGVGSWKGNGTTGKLQRLSALPGTLFEGIEPYLIFCSPEDNGPTDGLPTWTKNDQRRIHIKLEPPPCNGPRLRVERCSTKNGKLKPDANGTGWRILATK